MKLALIDNEKKKIKVIDSVKRRVVAEYDIEFGMNLDTDHIEQVLAEDDTD